MPAPVVLPQNFYLRPVIKVARDLLGKRLVRVIDGRRLSGTIIETEAYNGEEDQACHAHAGFTPRTKIMYGPAGHAYIYFTYGIHWMLNCVTGEVGFPAAVLIRALFPDDGLDIIAAHRPGIPRTGWTNGPAKICQAFHIDKSFNSKPLYNPRELLFLEYHLEFADESIQSSPRIGIDNVPEPWRSIPWRFTVNYSGN
jgi:DNA-3-methyladenine glycosylase